MGVTIGKSSAGCARRIQFLAGREMLMTTSCNYPAARTGLVRFDRSTRLRGLGRSGGSINATRRRSTFPWSVSFEMVLVSSMPMTHSTRSRSRCGSDGPTRKPLHPVGTRRSRSTQVQRGRPIGACNFIVSPNPTPPSRRFFAPPRQQRADPHELLNWR